MTDESVKMGEFSRDLKQLLDRHMLGEDIDVGAEATANFLTGTLAMYNDSLRKGKTPPEQSIYPIHPEIDRSAEERPSATRDLVRDLLKKADDAKEAMLVSHLLENPGFLATLDDYVVEETPLEIRSEDGGLNSFRFIATQEVRIRRKTSEEKAQEDREISKETFIERYNILKLAMDEAQANGDKMLFKIYFNRLHELRLELEQYDLRIDHNGNLESV